MLTGYLKGSLLPADEKTISNLQHSGTKKLTDLKAQAVTQHNQSDQCSVLTNHMVSQPRSAGFLKSADSTMYPYPPLSPPTAAGDIGVMSAKGLGSLNHEVGEGDGSDLSDVEQEGYCDDSIEHNIKISLRVERSRNKEITSLFYNTEQASIV